MPKSYNINIKEFCNIFRVNSWWLIMMFVIERDALECAQLIFYMLHSSQMSNVFYYAMQSLKVLCVDVV